MQSLFGAILLAEPGTLILLPLVAFSIWAVWRYRLQFEFFAAVIYIAAIAMIWNGALRVQEQNGSVALGWFFLILGADIFVIESILIGLLLYWSKAKSGDGA